MLEEKPRDFTALIKVKISNLSLGEHHFEFRCKAGEFADALLTEEIFPGFIHVFLRLEKNASEILAELKVQAVAYFECDRCLAPIEKNLEGSYSLCFLVGEPRENGVAEDDGIAMIDKNTIEIDFTEDVRETLLLAIPMKNICEDEAACEQRMMQNNSVAAAAPDASQENASQEDSDWKKALKQLEKKINSNHN
ncbi:protein of unknown function DUF177 [Chloroherpeton thalassium ATCC 35110]|uniref:DUF177 domain-containing protein n=1 Tax=Chloroherpeton thalassium (strain ATCC 35110 / GB-78) TaxID=517418 RepID=B3QTV2_CHLT3|nr:DUF177 domain-containing protein [Chloroherpeton thalassium]ACF14300.1 protein of unknown function DUF177 [Chloroherpeton thalassium ATCC 35110]